MQTHGAVARHQFERFLNHPDSNLDLARVALAIANEEYPDLDPRLYLRWFDEIAARIRRRANGEPGKTVDAISSVLFHEEGFTGNATDYYDPRNSFLNDVIDRKTGIPITLSIVFLEICARVGVEAQGIGLPGHFIVALAADRPILIDPFNRGARLSVDDCAALVRRSTGGRHEFHARSFDPTTRRQIVSRLLRNLINIYVHTHDDSRLLAVLDRLALVEPTSSSILGDRAIVCERIRYFGQALADCHRLLDLAPADAGSPGVRALLARLETDMRWVN